MTTDQFFETVEQVFATWHYDHPRILYALMRSLKPTVAVEVGTYRGYAAAYMARACIENGVGHVHCIDDFSEGMQQRYDEAHWDENLRLCGVRDHVTLLRGRSDEVTWPDKVDFAYLDGWHGYITVVHDFAQADLRGAECICLDDVTSTVGPSMMVQRVRENMRDRWDVVELFRDCGLAVCIRRKDRPPCNFSQELPGHPGMVMTEWTTEKKRNHLAEVSKLNGIDYTRVLL